MIKPEQVRWEFKPGWFGEAVLVGTYGDRHESTWLDYDPMFVEPLELAQWRICRRFELMLERAGKKS